MPLDQMITLKLEASRKTLYQRIRLKKKDEQGGDWLFSKNLPDKVAFVDRFYKKFKLIPADVRINTDCRAKADVYCLALNEIKALERSGFLAWQ